MQPRELLGLRIMHTLVARFASSKAKETAATSRRRSGKMTAEEERLRADSAFRERVRRSYAALATDIVDVKGMTLDVVGRIVEELRQ